jgi:phosphocarrier protein HPr
MLKQKIMIINKLGLHARASMKLISMANRFQSEILIHYQDYEVDAKDLLGVMTLGVTRGEEIELIISGEDETEALEKLTELIRNRFGESE